MRARAGRPCYGERNAEVGRFRGQDIETLHGGETSRPLVAGEASFARGGGHVFGIGREPERAGAEKGGTPFDGDLAGHAHRQNPDQVACVVREQLAQEALLAG